MSEKKEKLNQGAKKLKERKHYRGLRGVVQDLVGAIFDRPDIRGER